MKSSRLNITLGDIGVLLLFFCLFFSEKTYAISQLEYRYKIIINDTITAKSVFNKPDIIVINVSAT